MRNFVYDYNTVDSMDSERELEEVCNFLKKKGIRHWLSSGTLLGIHRDGKFLKGDTDLDIGIRGEDAESWLPEIPGYELRYTKWYKDKIFQTVFRSHRSIAIDLMWFWEDGDKIVNKNSGGTWVKPKDKFEHLSEITFKEVTYPCPEPEWYLKNRFIDWETPMPKDGREWGSGSTGLGGFALSMQICICKHVC